MSGKSNQRDALSAAAVAFVNMIEEKDVEIAARTAERDDAREKLAANDAEIERLKSKLKDADANADHCRKEMLKALQETSRVANMASQREAEYQHALRETREALKKCESRMTRSAGCICVCPVIDGHAAECEVMAVLARHAHLIGDGESHA